MLTGTLLRVSLGYIHIHVNSMTFPPVPNPVLTGNFGIHITAVVANLKPVFIQLICFPQPTNAVSSSSFFQRKQSVRTYSNIWIKCNKGVVNSSPALPHPHTAHNGLYPRNSPTKTLTTIKPSQFPIQISSFSLHCFVCMTEKWSYQTYGMHYQWAGGGPHTINKLK